MHHPYAVPQCDVWPARHGRPVDRFGQLEVVAPATCHQNIVQRTLHPVQIAAGITKVDGKGRAVPKYTGLHCLRHFYASWCINRKKEGGLELPPKLVQERLGHATLAMTMDTYGHLFPREGEHAEIGVSTEHREQRKPQGLRPGLSKEISMKTHLGIKVP
jgi:integrase